MKFSFTSNRIAALEEAIEKKTKEFDLLKKERQSSVSQPYSKSSDKFEPPHDSARPSSIEGQSGPQIEIVRSYPTGFQTVEVEGMTTPEVLDVVDKNSPPDSQFPFMNDSIEIVLFSETKKDTDFVSAWKELSSHLVVASQPQVVINLRNVMFLYEKELNYLEKIKDIVEKARGSVKFINCHDELLSILSKRPALARLLKG